MSLGSRSVTLDGSGDGQVRLPQVRPLRRWEVSRISLSITGGVSSNLSGLARVYRNDSIPGDFIDGTDQPWNDVFAAPLQLEQAEALLVVFSGCGPGERATVTVEGTEVYA